METNEKSPVYCGLVRYDNIEDIISRCIGAISVYDECLERSTPKTLEYAHLIGAKHATEAILKRLQDIHPINIK